MKVTDNHKPKYPGNRDEKKKILLALLPFWTPLNPPMGIACLKSFIQEQGWEVTTVDANVEDEFREIYDSYIQGLKKCIPAEKRGNFYNTGNDVIQDHMTAHMLNRDTERCNRLIKTIIQKHYFYPVNDSLIVRLNHIIAEFYTRLRRYITGLVQRESPGIFGLSVYKGTFAPSLFAYQLIKEKYPYMQTVMGGGIFADHLAVGSPNFHHFMQNTPYIDSIIVGEGEWLFLKWLKGELPRNQKVYTHEDIKGQTLDLSTALIPDFSDFKRGHYTELAAYTSRSCPYQCSFCAETVNWGKYRKKSAARVVKELIQLKRQWGIQLFMMSDSLLNSLITHLAKELIAEEEALYWDGYLRVDAQVCHTQNTLQWRRADFYRARLGLESGSQRILEAMNKKLTPTQIKRALAALAEVGIKTTTYWVIGHPGETEDDFQETLNILEELKDQVYEAECNPFRYYLTGQVKSRDWGKKNNPIPLYPAETRDMLMLQTWIMPQVQPNREVIYDRVNRFVRHCAELDIPNPYSWNDIHKADQRWQKLHPNSVPPLMAFQDKTPGIDECKNAQKILRLQNTFPEDDDFNF